MQEAGSGGQVDTRPSSGALLDDLRQRRDDGESLPACAHRLELAGIRLVREDLSGLDLSGADFAGAQLIECDLSRARLVAANLSSTVIHATDLTEAELLGANLTDADLTNSTFARAGLGTARLDGAVLFGARCGGATFSGADLTRGDLRTADLTDTRMIDAILQDATLAGAKLVNADLTRAQVDGASFRDADLQHSQIRYLSGYHHADWIHTDIRDVDFTGAWNVRRHIQDENYIAEFRSQSRLHELLYKAWWITSDCGRSLLRWSLWTVLVAAIYALAYTQVDIDWGAHETAISPAYYSVVTFTTLGYGDVLPGSATAQVLAMSEVILGYLSLGGVMSILSDKMARRAG